MTARRGRPLRSAAGEGRRRGRRRDGAGADGETGRARSCRNRADRDWEVRVPVKAGARDVQVAFVKQTSALAETVRLPFLRPYPAGVNIAEQRTGAYLRSVEIAGPYDPTGAGTVAEPATHFRLPPRSRSRADGVRRARLCL